MERDHPRSSRYEHPLLPREVQEEFRRQGHWEGLTLARIVHEWARRDPGRRAVVGSRELSYGQLWDEASRVAGWLRAEGLKPGESLLAVLANSWQGIVLEVASSIAGAVLVPRSPHLSPSLALNLFEQLDVRGLVLPADLAVRAEWQSVLTTMKSRMEGGPVLLQGHTAVEADPGAAVLERVAASGPSMYPVDVDPAAPCLVLSTGGTTGVPKSILHCSETLVYAVRQFGMASEFTGADTHVAFAPYGHAGGSVFDIYMPLLHGASILPLARWRAEQVVEEIERWGGTFFVAMGTHIFDLLAVEGAADRLRSVRLVLSGAAPDSLFEDGEKRLGFKIVRVYGCGECPGHAIGRIHDPAETRLRHDGIPFPCIEYRLVGADGNPVPTGTPGEYQCRGPNLFMGYAGQPELTAEMVTEDGFYRSGDVMVESSDGYLTWTGRTKEIIRRGGLQIDPVEMENLLSQHPALSTVVVVGRPDARLGEKAVVVAVPSSADSAPGLDELCSYLLSRGLPRQSLPEDLLYTDAIPRTDVGKFHRAEVKRRVTEVSAGAERAWPTRGIRLRDAEAEERHA
jgi:cyclohexanecarboxylate-CoA ligase